MKKIREIIENAVLTHGEDISHGDERSIGVYTLFAAAGDEKGIRPVRIKLKEYRLEGQNVPKGIKAYFESKSIIDPYASVYDNKVLFLENIEKEEPSSSAESMTAKTATDNYPSGSSEISVAELLSLVNSEYQKYIPKKSQGKQVQNFQGSDFDKLLEEGRDAQARAEAGRLLERFGYEELIQACKRAEAQTAQLRAAGHIPAKNTLSEEQLRELHGEARNAYAQAQAERVMETIDAVKAEENTSLSGAKDDG